MPVDSYAVFNQIPQSTGTVIGRPTPDTSFQSAAFYDGVYTDTADAGYNAAQSPLTDNVTETIQKCNVVYFTDSAGNKNRVGLNADDIALLAPGAVSGTMAVHTDMVAVLVKAVQELQAQITALQPAPTKTAPSAPATKTVTEMAETEGDASPKKMARKRKAVKI